MTMAKAWLLAFAIGISILLLLPPASKNDCVERGGSLVQEFQGGGVYCLPPNWRELDLDYKFKEF